VVSKTQLLLPSILLLRFATLGSRIVTPMVRQFVVLLLLQTVQHMMGLKPWVNFIGDPKKDAVENSHGLYKYQPYVAQPAL